jgi:hypothetical protein
MRTEIEAQMKKNEKLDELHHCVLYGNAKFGFKEKERK